MSGLIKIFDAIGNIAKVFESIGELAINIVNLFTNALKILLEAFTPNKFLNDLIYGFFAAFGLLFHSLFSSLAPSNLINKISGKVKQVNPPRGIMGMHKQKGPDGKYLPANKSTDRKCFPPTFARMILMVLCPPFALFLHVGLARWYYVVLCAVLTVYGYYFPGLIYAALQILC